MANPKNHAADSQGEIQEQVDATRNRLSSTINKIGQRLAGDSREIGEDRKRSATHQLQLAGSALRDVAARLRGDGQESVATPVARIADSMTSVARYFESTSFEDVVKNGAESIRRHPAATLGIALAAGLLAGRFFGSSSDLTPNQ